MQRPWRRQAAGYDLADLGWAALLACLVVLALWMGWVGYAASDDAIYFDGARNWLHGADPGRDHWSTRFPLLWSFAAALAIYGETLRAFAATALAWYLILILETGLMAAAIAGRRAGWIAAVLVATMPVVATNASIVNCDLPEAVFLLAGIWLLAGATGRGRALLSGVCFGLAILCRETAMLALAGLVPLAWHGEPSRRRLLAWTVLGIFVPLGMEAIFQGLMTGHPLRRYDIAAHHDGHIDRAANLEGNFLLNPILDPLLVLLVSNEFGLIFWFGIGAIADYFERNLDGYGRRAIFIAGTMAVTSFVLIGLLVHTLVLNPRYFTFAGLVTAIMVACWIAGHRAMWRAMLLAMMAATNLSMLGLANAHPHWDADALVRAAKEHPGSIIVAAKATVVRAMLPLRFQGSRNVRTSAGSGATLRLVPAGPGKPDAGWKTVSAYPSPPTPVGAALSLLGCERMVPAGLQPRIFHPNEPMLLLARADR